MKKIKLLVATLLISNAISAQITLENTYPGNQNYSNFDMVNLKNSGSKYMIIDYSLNEIKLYNLNHTLWKTITLPTIPGFDGYYYENISENLFDLDGQVECLIIFYNTNTYLEQTVVLNEDGTFEFVKQNSFFEGIVKTENNDFKLIFKDAVNNNKTIYSLPGTSSNLGLNNGSDFGDFQLNKKMVNHIEKTLNKKLYK
jgi:hypothetical protein